MVFHAFKNEEMKVSKHSPPVCMKVEKIKSHCVLGVFCCHFNYIDYSFSSAIGTSTLLNHPCPSLILCFCAVTLQSECNDYY